VDVGCAWGVRPEVMNVKTGEQSVSVSKGKADVGRTGTEEVGHSDGWGHVLRSGQGRKWHRGRGALLAAEERWGQVRQKKNECVGHTGEREETACPAQMVRQCRVTPWRSGMAVRWCKRGAQLSARRKGLYR